MTENDNVSLENSKSTKSLITCAYQNDISLTEEILYENRNLDLMEFCDKRNYTRFIKIPLYLFK